MVVLTDKLGMFFFFYQNNGKAGYNVGDKNHFNPGDNIPEFYQLPMVINTKYLLLIPSYVIFYFIFVYLLVLVCFFQRIIYLVHNYICILRFVRSST